MRSTALRVAAVGLGLLWGADAARAEEKEIPWAKTFNDALGQAKKAHKPVMVDFYTDWCGWCKKLDADTYTDKRVIKLADQFVAVKVNAEKEGEAVAKRYGITGFPTILFLDPETTAPDGAGKDKDQAADADEAHGKARKAEGVVGKVLGYMPPEGFSEKLEAIAKGYKEFPELQGQYKKDPKDLQTAGKLAVGYIQRGDEARAEEIVREAEKVDPDNSQDQLTKAYNAIGDKYQEEQQFGKAVPMFSKAVKTGKKPEDVAYAQMSIAVCDLMQNKLKEALPELEAVTKLEGAPKDLKEQAEQYLKQLRPLLDREKKAKDSGAPETK